MEIIDISRKVFSKSKEFEVREDIIVPDSKPDIVSIIDCSNITYAYKTELTSGKIKLDGSIEAYIDYLSSDGGTRGITNTLNFIDTIEDTQIKEESYFKYEIETIKIEHKMLNERKVSLLFTLKIKYDVFEKQKVEFYNDFDNIENIQKMENLITVNSLLGVGISKASIKEDIKISDMDIVAEILKSQININNSEYKISYNKVLAKSEANINIIYLTEDDRISNITANLPIMSFIEMDNIKEGDICNVSYQIRNVLIKPNNQENHSITCQIEFEILAEGYLQKELNIVNDIYSLTNELSFNSKIIELENSMKYSDDSLTNINERIEIEDLKTVFEVESNPRIIKNTVSSNTSNIEGEIDLKVYYEARTESGLKLKNLEVPFIVKTNKIVKENVRLLSKEFDVDGGNLVLKMQIVVLDEESTKQTITVIDNVEVKENIKNMDYSMVVYLVKPKDTIWKIAKTFKTTMDSIIKINNLENPDLIYPGDKLYIMQ